MADQHDTQQLTEDEVEERDTEKRGWTGAAPVEKLMAEYRQKQEGGR